ncbi:hypothetical protein FQN57_002042 [Myotisia sp. PD_48]|nr:hypothetical protein FQN57_002042 [Myotisia sp. PD_48]
MPRYMLFLRATAESEGASRPTLEQFQQMGDYYNAMNNAGIVLSADGLVSSSEDSARIIFHGTKDDLSHDVIRGPFPLHEIVSGYWILKVKDMNEAIEWAKKCPLYQDGATLELRRLSEMADFEDIMTEEMTKKFEEMAEKTEAKIKKGAS